MENSHFQSLHDYHVPKLRATLSKTYSFIQFFPLVVILYYRGAFFFNKNDTTYQMVPLLPWLMIFAAELLCSIMWLLKQPLYWWPIIRTVFPERLPKDEDLPGLDVFICTADPKKEPTFDVMNTIISAMALDYPARKLNVYLSDDGGASVTLNGIKEAWMFATWWLPFCRRYNVQPVCPNAYFEKPEEGTTSKEFIEDKKIVKEKYENFKRRVCQRRMEKVEGDSDTKISSRDHPAFIQVVNEDLVGSDALAVNPQHTDMPLLLYIAREKRPSHPHNFKAGALNVLLRISSTFSNSPYILFLDCDMYCNDSISARQAMCFHLDPKVSPSLGWVQYPHKFHNISESDIYDSQMRTIWPVLYPGLDGLQGPVLSGTNFYIKRKALYGGVEISYRNDIKELRNLFGSSNDFIKSFSQNDKPRAIHGSEITSVSLQEAQFLASCAYEKGTKWGEEVGFRYESLVEDVMTGYRLQSQGWRSVFLNPARPQFLGSATTNLNDMLTQGTRWYAGLLQIGLSKHCPLIYSPSKMRVLHKLPYTWICLFPLDCFPALCFAIIPPMCFLYGIPLYPKVIDPFFIAFAYVFVSSRLKQLFEVHISGGSQGACLNEQRITMIKAVTCYVYGTLEFVMAKLGVREATFTPTNKAGNDDTTKWYQMGRYDFRTSNMVLVPLVTVVTLNLLCFVGGVARMILMWNWDTVFAQVLLSFYVLVLSVPVIEAMFLRTDNGRIPLSTTLISTLLSMILLCLGYFILLH